jgi:secondary thiamine-phosphate synthase enzyme
VIDARFLLPPRGAATVAARIAYDAGPPQDQARPGQPATGNVDCQPPPAEAPPDHEARIPKPEFRSPNPEAKEEPAVIHQDQITLDTTGHRDMHDLTDRVNAIVRNAGVTTGLAHIFNVGSTGAIGCIEFEPGLERDLPHILDTLMPPSRDYGHEQTWRDGNGHSHLQATVLGFSETVPITHGRLRLGTWQQIFHIECDIKPRQRTIVVTVQGE